eukprot:TRINITY_DN1450_c0_g4_i1.p2 TRINITY_DN1450_c0_g4~~TRINITY_DN1450_c0_g4_i1.p2  ORF type:complete len:241 (+),score=79.77 TRINITY_DN1450_c0_g4_i1:236-958(+)
MARIGEAAAVSDELERSISLIGEEKEPDADKRTADPAPALVSKPSTVEEVTPDRLFSLVSSAQEVKENKERLDKQFGGTLQLAAGLGVDLITGLSPDQVIRQRERFGNNCFPEPPMKGFFKLFMESFNDTILQVLIVAAVVSLIIGIITEPGHGWIEGTAILIAVFIVAIVTATNDYSKELQFRALEKTSEESERALVLRNGETLQVRRRRPPHMRCYTLCPPLRSNCCSSMFRGRTQEM